MVRFDANRKCPACGDDSPVNGRDGRGGQEGALAVYNGDKQVITRHCNRCYFRWDELPLWRASEDNGEIMTGMEVAIGQQ